MTPLHQTIFNLATMFGTIDQSRTHFNLEVV